MKWRRPNAIAAGLAIVTVAVLFVARNWAAEKPLDRLVATSDGQRTVYQGSWLFPRGGPYVLGFESPGPAVLEVGGRVVARGKGEVQKRHVFQSGPVAVRFTAPIGARLLWHPPGRRGRGELEYVPASSLSADPPEQAVFGAWPGAAPVDGVISILLGLTLLGFLLFVLREKVRAVDRRVFIACAAVFALALALRLFDLGAAGQTFDEDVNWSAGKNYVSNWLGGDFSQQSWRFNFQHPPISKYVMGVGGQFADGYGPARALSAVMVALACALLVVIGRRLYTLRVGVVAGVIAGLSPHLIAHGKVVGHEAPAVLLWTLAVYLALSTHDGIADLDARAARRRIGGRLVVLGVVFGLAVFSRFVNVLMAPLLGAILLLSAPAGSRLRITWMGLSILPVVGFAVGLLLWPRLWETPFAHLSESWDKLKKPHAAEPFLGTMTNTPGRHYFLVYLYATAPVAVLLATGAWLLAAVRERKKAYAVLALWLAVPLLVAFSPVRQDGVRYIMPSLVALSLAAAVGIDFLARRLEGRVSFGRHIFPGLAVALGAYLLVVNIRIHPYYLDYYGEQVGGPKRVAAKRLFETGWWGEGVKEATDYINAHAEPGAIVWRRCNQAAHLGWFRGDLWADVARPEQAEWFLVQPVWSRCPLDGTELVYEVKAQGAPLARVYRRSARAPGEDPQ